MLRVTSREEMEPCTKGNLTAQTEQDRETENKTEALKGTKQDDRKVRSLLRAQIWALELHGLVGLQKGKSLERAPSKGCCP